MSDTPRTDERLRTTSLMNTLDALNDLYDFARTLERDLAAANAENAKLRKHCEAMWWWIDNNCEFSATQAINYRLEFPKEPDK